MKALLLSAGFGSRLKPYTDHTPKVLMPVCGKPVLQYWLEALTDSNICDLMVNTHYLAEKVDQFLEESEFDVRIVHERQLLGTGGTLLSNKKFFGDDDILLIHADNLSYFNLTDFINAHHNRPDHCHITMMTFQTTDPRSCGIVELDEQDVVIDFHEKVNNPPGDHANAAVYILDSAVMSFLESLGKEEIDFSTEVIPEFMGYIYTWHNSVYHRDIGTPESYHQAQNEFKEFL